MSYRYHFINQLDKMRKLVIVFFISIFFMPTLYAQNYVINGGFEYGINANWNHHLGTGALATFGIAQNTYTMEGAVGLKVHVEKTVSGGKGIQSTTGLTVGADSLYLLRFWARGKERSKIYVEVEGSQTPGVLYEMHRGRTFFHLPFKTSQKNLKIHFYFQDAAVTYNLDGVEVLDQNNKQNIDVLNTWIWNHNLTGKGWTAGDNDISCLLPDGRTVWFFNDSFYGTNDVSNNPLYEVGTFIRNAMVVQELDGSLKTRPYTNQHGQNVYFEVPVPTYNTQGGQNNFFWVGDAMLEDEELKVHLIEVAEVSGGVENTKNSYLAKFSYPGLNYLGLEKLPGFTSGYETFLTDKDSIYLYKSEGVGIWDRYSHVARTKKGNLNGKEPWEYWNGKNWTANETESARINNMGADGFMKLGEGNFAHVSMPNLSNQIQVSFAPSPEGPWTPKKTVYTIPNDSAYWFYMPNFHNQLSNGNYSISYSVNAWYKLFFAFESFVDKYWYRPRYIQVDLLGLSPYSEKKDCAGIPDGDAYLDKCDHCVGGTTGLKPCVKGMAKLYSECDFMGDGMALEVGDYTLADLKSLGFIDNDLSSVELENGYEIELFDNNHFEGDHIVIASSTACLNSDTFNDKASSLIIRRKGISNLSGTYAIQNKQNGLFMSVRNRSTVNNALIEQASYRGDNSQKFKVQYIGNGYYKLVNTASNMALNVVNFSKEPNKSIEQWDGAQFDITDGVGTISDQYNDSPVAVVVKYLIDNKSNTRFLTAHPRAWVQFHCDNPQVVSRYSITSANDAEVRDPKNWSLLGSNDGVSWVRLDTLSNIDFPSRLEEKTFDFENTTAYSYYRLNMECNSGNVLQLGEWKLIFRPDANYSFDSQLFVIQDAHDGYVRIINKNSDLLLEVLDGDYTPGTNIRQMADIGQQSVLWKLLDPADIPTEISKIDKQKEPTDLVVYPNPVGDVLNLDLGEEWSASNLSIFNLSGVKLWSGLFKNNPINVGQLKSGFYLIQVSNGNRKKVGHFIKE